MRREKFLPRVRRQKRTLEAIDENGGIDPSYGVQITVDDVIAEIEEESDGQGEG